MEKRGAATTREPIRVLVVDDERLAREHLCSLLEELPDVELAGEARDGVEAIDRIREIEPGIVFLDVQMPGKSGLDVVRQVGPDHMPVTVFVTAYDKFAVDAFELAAVDYLLKPYSDARFAEAFRRGSDRVRAQDWGALHDELRAVLDASYRGGGRRLERIAVQERGSLVVIQVADVDYIAASGSYCEIHAKGSKHLHRGSLNDLEAQLDPARFFRAHRSVIVRLAKVESLTPSRGGKCELRLQGGIKLPVSRYRREKLEKKLGRM